MTGTAVVAARGAPESLGTLADRHVALGADVATRFFESSADEVARCCLAMARRFERGGRLLVFGSGAAATDAQHVAVEFVHPVLVGKRALPAVALAGDVGFAHRLDALGRAGDIALGISGAAPGAEVVAALARARAVGMLTVLTHGAANGDATGAGDIGVDFSFAVPSDDVMIVQEVQETLCHVLWELVHVFLDRGAS